MTLYEVYTSEWFWLLIGGPVIFWLLEKLFAWLDERD